MRNLREKIIVVFLLAVLFLPLYAWMVNVVDALDDNNLIQCFELRSARESIVTDVFDIGDTLIVAVGSGTADAYDLTIYGNSSSIFVRNGTFCEGIAQIEVPLDPPTFSAGSVYVMAFDAYAYDYPIPGAFSDDFVDSPFSVASTETKLGLEVEFDDSIRGLYLEGKLTTVEGYAVANEPVKFLWQLTDKPRVTEGWVPIGCAVSDGTGLARMHIAFGLPHGSYRVKAVFEGNTNYGRSENLTDVSIVLNGGGSGDIEWANFLESNLYDLSMTNSSVGDFTLQVSNSTPYALMPMTAYAKCTSAVGLDGQVWISFFLDYLNSTGFLGSSVAKKSTINSGGGGGGGGGGNHPMEGDPNDPTGGSTEYIYEAFLFLAPQTIGNHTLIAGVVSGSASDFAFAIEDGVGFAALDSVALNIQRCPANIVLDYPDVFYGSVFPIEACVSKPRPYEAYVDDFSVTTSLARQLSYNGVEYVADDEIEGLPLELYLNGQLTAVCSTDVNGIARFELNSTFTSANVRVLMDDSRLFSETVAEAILALRKVKVHSSFPPNEGFDFNFTVNGASENSGFYVGLNSSLQAAACLTDQPFWNQIVWNQPVWNLPVSVVHAKLVATVENALNGAVSIPSTCRYLRVMATELITGGGGGGGGGDLEGFGLIEDSTTIYDNYCLSLVVRLDFNSGEQVYADKRGFARVPCQATSVSIYSFVPLEEAKIQFFRIILDKTIRTDDYGKIGEVLSQAETGRYLVQLKLPEGFDVTVVNRGSISYWHLVQTNLVGFLDVVKRPVALSFSHSPTNVTVGGSVDLTVSAVDGAINSPTSAMLIQCSINGASIGSAYTNSSGMAVFSWTPTSNIVYNVVASYCGSAFYEASSASLTFDLRYPTNLRVSTEAYHCSEKSLDGYLYKFGTSYPPPNLNVPVTTYTWFAVGQHKHYLPENQIYYEVYRGYVSFDTSALPDDADVISAALRLKTKTDLTIYTTDFVVQVLGGSQPIYGSSLDAADWGVGTALVGQWNTANYVDETYVEIAIDASQINLGGRTQFELRSSREGTEPMVPDETVEFYSADSVGNAPYLDVTYRLGRADNSTVNVDASVEYQFHIEDLPPNSCGEKIEVYVDGSFYRTAQISASLTTDFPWKAELPGVHYINVSYGGNQYYKPDYLYFAANASASPVSLDFSVAPTTFEAGGSVNLWARAINPLTGQPLPFSVEIGFWQDGYGYGTLVNDQYYPTENGVATTSWTYPSDGAAHTIVAKVEENPALGSVILAIRPITLTVGVETRLWLWVERGLTNTDHTVHARLVRANDTAPISGQPIKLDVNGTVYTLTTNGTGQAKQPLNLVAVGGQTTTYQVRAVFEGAGSKTKSLTVKDPYGRDYPVCTTMQWDFKPSQNIVTLTVEAPKTDATVSAPASPSDKVTVTQTTKSTTVNAPPPKTPEQLQQEAEQSGWLTTWHEFSWWYPWYRLHLRIHVNPTIEVAFNPILPGGESWYWTGLEFFASIAQNIMEEMLIDIPTIFIQYLVAKALALWNPVAGVVAEFVKFGVQMGLLVFRNWNDKLGLAASALVSFIMGLMALKVDISALFINAILGFIPAAAGRILTILNNKLVFMLITTELFIQTRWLGVLEMTLDWIVGGFAIARYFGWI